MDGDKAQAPTEPASDELLDAVARAHIEQAQTDADNERSDGPDDLPEP